MRSDHHRDVATSGPSTVPAAHWLHLDGPTGRPIDLLVGDEFDWLGAALTAGVFSYSDAYRLLFDLLTPGAVVLDLGAHIGTFALAAASLGCRVIAFEPSPRNAALLQASLAANHFDDVTVVPAAVVAKPGTVRFRPEGAFGQISTGNHDDRLIEVDAVTVPDVLANLEIGHVDAVKIDIEGSELGALEGMTELLVSDSAPPLVIEGNAHTLRHFGYTPGDLLARTEAAGYANYLFLFGQLVPVTPTSTQPRTVVDYLAVKPTTELPAGWVVRPPLAPHELAGELLAEARTGQPDKRAFVRRALDDAPDSLACEPAARLARALLALDPAPYPPGPSEQRGPVRRAPRAPLRALRDDCDELLVQAKALQCVLDDLPERIRARRPPR
jgi:FkbM family methyltransferase